MVKTLVQSHLQRYVESRTQIFWFENLIVRRPRGSEESSQNKVLGVSGAAALKVQGLNIRRAFASPFHSLQPTSPLSSHWGRTGCTAMKRSQLEEKKSTRLKFDICHFHFYFLLWVQTKGFEKRATNHANIWSLGCLLMFSPGLQDIKKSDPSFGISKPFYFPWSKCL